MGSGVESTGVRQTGAGQAAGARPTPLRAPTARDLAWLGGFPQLREGSTGPHVAELKQLLQAKGYSVTSGDTLDRATLEQVRQFQTDHQHLGVMVDRGDVLPWQNTLGALKGFQVEPGSSRLAGGSEASVATAATASPSSGSPGAADGYSSSRAAPTPSGGSGSQSTTVRREEVADFKQGLAQQLLKQGFEPQLVAGLMAYPTLLGEIAHLSSVDPEGIKSYARQELARRQAEGPDKPYDEAKLKQIGVPEEMIPVVLANPALNEQLQLFRGMGATNEKIELFFKQYYGGGAAAGAGAAAAGTAAAAASGSTTDRAALERAGVPKDMLDEVAANPQVAQHVLSLVQNGSLKPDQTKDFLKALHVGEAPGRFNGNTYGLPEVSDSGHGARAAIAAAGVAGGALVGGTKLVSAIGSGLGPNVTSALGGLPGAQTVGTVGKFLGWAGKILPPLALAANTFSLASNWENMSTWDKVVTGAGIVGAGLLTVAAFTAAAPVTLTVLGTGLLAGQAMYEIGSAVAGAVPQMGNAAYGAAAGMMPGR